MPSRKKMADVDEFESYARIINSLIITLRRPEDREYAQKILKHSKELNESKQIDIQDLNNEFVSYFLKVLYTTASTQPMEIYECWFDPSKPQVSAGSTKTIWIEENRSYLAMEKMADGTIIFYSAVATDPKAGWDQGGIKKALEQHEEEERQRFEKENNTKNGNKKDKKVDKKNNKKDKRDKGNKKKK